MGNDVFLVVVNGSGLLRLVGKLKKETPDTCEFEDLFIMNMQYDPSKGRIGIGLLPFAVKSDTDNYVIAKNQLIVLPTKVSADIEREYISHTSGLVLPNSPKDQGIHLV